MDNLTDAFPLPFGAASKSSDFVGLQFRELGACPRVWTVLSQYSDKHRSCGTLTMEKEKFSSLTSGH
jgi:hypothetical protein